jgi:molybdenum cofactor synthesis domain-containing protein
MFRELVSVDEAHQILAKNFKPMPVGKEKVPLSEAFNRILALDLVSPLDIPPFNRSTVDGFAVRADDTFGAQEDRPAKAKLIGEVKVGEAPKVKVKKGTVAEIVTGAPIPPGADAVVMVEHTEQKDDAILIHQPVAHGENVMKEGSDIHKDEMVLRKGTAISPYEVGVIAAIGLNEVEVYKRPRVAIFSTGAEVIEPGKPLKQGKIYDINAHALSSAVTECGGQPLNMGIIQDETESMTKALKTALNAAEAIMTSGGVSVGPTDIIPKVLAKLGKPGVVVYGVAIRPGKPTTIALINDKPVFSLPGHPASSMLIFHLFVRPILLAMAGREPETPVTMTAVTSERLFPSRGRRTYVTVKLRKDKSGEILASPVPTGLSGAITTLAKADGFIVIHENQQFIDKGQKVKVELLKPNLYHSLAR